MSTEVKDFGFSAGGGVNATTGFFPEGQLPSTVNDGMRSVMGAMRRVIGDISGENTATFTAQTYTLPSVQELTSLARGHCFTWIAEAANTGTASLAVGGLAAVPMKRGASHLAARDIVTGQAVTTVFDGTNFQVLGAGANASSRASALSAFRAVSSGTTSMPNDVTKYNIDLASESFDYGSNFASNQYTVPRTGLYQLNGTVYVTGTPASVSRLTAYIRLDAGYYYLGVAFMESSINQAVAVSGSMLLSLSAGQTVGLAAEHNCGATITASAGSGNVLAGFFLGEIP